MTYTPEEHRAATAGIRRVGRIPGAWPEEAAAAALDAVLPGYTQRIQEQGYAEGYIDGYHDSAVDDVSICDNRVDWVSGHECFACREYARAAALAAPVEPAECNDECMRTGFCVCDDGRVWNDCPMHGAHPPPLETSAAWGDPAPPVEQPDVWTAGTVDVYKSTAPVEQPPTQEKR